MVVEIRIYKRHDTDLIALVDAGYPVRDMLKSAVIAFANGHPLHYFIDEAVPYDPKGRNMVHFRVSVRDKMAEAMILGVRKGMRNAFVKAVLRNALLQQNLSAYFENGTFYSLIGKSMDIPIDGLSSVVSGSYLRAGEREYVLPFLSNRVLSIKREAAEKITPAYAAAPAAPSVTPKGTAPGPAPLPGPALSGEAGIDNPFEAGTNDSSDDEDAIASLLENL